MKFGSILFFAPWLSLVLVADQGPVKWKKLHLTQEFWAEGACVADVNRDGHTDILCGPFWYEGPSFGTRHEIYPAQAEFSMLQPDGSQKTIRGFKGFVSGQNGYSDNFLSFSWDVNGDGWMDYIVVGHPGQATFWYENSQGMPGPWRRHLALANTDNESPAWIDVTGDGVPELVCMNKGSLGFASVDPAHPTQPWKWHAVARNDAWQWNTHGLGYGDVNGDGRMDLLTAHNWWEQPVDSQGGSLWKKHNAIFNNGGSHMFAYDVNGDGWNDVITAWEGHGYGLYWYEQTRDKTWQRHVIMANPPEPGKVKFSQPHALDLADINGDGLKDIITGKRIWAHGPDGDVDPNGPAVLYWFELKRGADGPKFVPHLIDHDSGVGTQVLATDVDQDGRLDVVVGNKKGLFIHLQQ
jgi:hypothetical protein